MGINSAGDHFQVIFNGKNDIPFNGDVYWNGMDRITHHQTALPLITLDGNRLDVFGRSHLYIGNDFLSVAYYLSTSRHLASFCLGRNDLPFFLHPFLRRDVRFIECYTEAIGLPVGRHNTIAEQIHNVRFEHQVQKLVCCIIF